MRALLRKRSLSTARPVTEAEFAAAMDGLVLESRATGSPTLVLGVSGGPDSMALALLTNRWARPRGWSVVPVIVDHGLRPESATEAAHVKQTIESRLGMNCRVERVTWDTRGGRPPLSRMQDAARDARFEALTTAARTANARAIVTGHHRGDDAETRLLRLHRASGLAGLRGLPALTHREFGLPVLRPLLAFAKDRLEATCHAGGLADAIVRDPSNANMAFDRVRARRVLQLCAEASSPSPNKNDREAEHVEPSQRLAVTADRVIAGTVVFAEAARAIEDEAASLLQRHAESLSDFGVVVFDPEAMVRDASCREVVLRALERVVVATSGRPHSVRSAALQRLLTAVQDPTPRTHVLPGVSVRRLEAADGYSFPDRSPPLSLCVAGATGIGELPALQSESVVPALGEQLASTGARVQVNGGTMRVDNRFEVSLTRRSTHSSESLARDSLVDAARSIRAAPPSTVQDVHARVAAALAPVAAQSSTFLIRRLDTAVWSVLQRLVGLPYSIAPAHWITVRSAPVVCRAVDLSDSIALARGLGAFRILQSCAEQGTLRHTAGRSPFGPSSDVEPHADPFIRALDSPPTVEAARRLFTAEPRALALARQVAVAQSVVAVPALGYCLDPTLQWDVQFSPAGPLFRAGFDCGPRADRALNIQSRTRALSPWLFIRSASIHRKTAAFVSWCNLIARAAASAIPSVTSPPVIATPEWLHAANTLPVHVHMHVQQPRKTATAVAAPTDSDDPPPPLSTSTAAVAAGWGFRR